MEPYGLKGNCWFEYPDAADCRNMGAPSRMHPLKPKTKKRARRIWKRKARKAAQEEIRCVLEASKEEA